METPLLTTLAHPLRHGALIRILTWRDITGRYRGSLLGSLWSLLTPLLMLGVFTFVFGVVAPTRWPGAEQQGMGMFALRLLAGMVVHSLMAEVLQRAPGLVTGQPNYVTKVVFPLETLAWVALLTAGFHAAMALLVLVVLNALFGTGLAPSLLALPLVALPYVLLLPFPVWALVWLSRLRLEVTGGELIVGRAHLPLEVISRAVVVPASAKSAALGRQLDPAAYVQHRPWIGTMVLVVLDDPDDPTPYWLISTRRPAELQAALGCADHSGH